MNQTKRTVLVTGASRGIGEAICGRLLSKGCDVIGVSRSESGNHVNHDRFFAVQMDLSRIEELPVHLKKMRKRFPEISDIICNAGAGLFGSLENLSPTQIQSLINTNLTAHILTAREFVPALKQRKHGNFIFIGSEAALRGGQKGSVYCATKFAIRGFSQAIREECAGSGVRVGLINPGMVKTDFFHNLNFKPGDSQDQHLVPEDVADAVWLMINSRVGNNIDEINLSPQKHVIQFD